MEPHDSPLEIRPFRRRLRAIELPQLSDHEPGDDPIVDPADHEADERTDQAGRREKIHP